MKRFLVLVSLLQLAVCVPQQNFNRDQPSNSGSFLPTSFSGNVNNSGTDFRRTDGFSNLQPNDNFHGSNQPTDNFRGNNQGTDNFRGNNQGTDNFRGSNQGTDNFRGSNQGTDNFRGSTDNFRGSGQPTDNFGGNHFGDDNYRRNLTSTENMFGITSTTDGYRTSNRHDVFQYDHTEATRKANEQRPGGNDRRYGGASDSSIASLSLSMSCFLVGFYCIVSHL